MEGKITILLVYIYDIILTGDDINNIHNVALLLNQ